ncbi:MAG: hypothetical protein KDK05_20610, partial [Candidatus Competibacteraceae bacterium]|nr:hypothetical protein [Candidatus Competibacteraceae bacterium]
QRKRLTTELPSIKIPATIHACIRFDQRRRYKPNDIHDIGHATAALPYFDAFLTEHSLRHLLTREDLALDRLYGCTVISDPSEAIESLTAMVAEE